MAISTKEYTPTYWNNAGLFQSEYNSLFAKLVPHEGKAKTDEGEALRCISRIYYDRYNNGSGNGLRYEKDFVRQYCHRAKFPIAYCIVNNSTPGEKLDKTVDMLIQHIAKVTQL